MPTANVVGQAPGLVDGVGGTITAGMVRVTYPIFEQNQLVGLFPGQIAQHGAGVQQVLLAQHGCVNLGG